MKTSTQKKSSNQTAIAEFKAKFPARGSHQRELREIRHRGSYMVGIFHCGSRDSGYTTEHLHLKLSGPTEDRVRVKMIEAIATDTCTYYRRPLGC